MCKEFKTIMMWQGADCKFESCDKTQYMTELYNNKPVTGI